MTLGEQTIALFSIENNIPKIKILKGYHYAHMSQLLKNVGENNLTLDNKKIHFIKGCKVSRNKLGFINSVNTNDITKADLTVLPVLPETSKLMTVTKWVPLRLHSLTYWLSQYRFQDYMDTEGFQRFENARHKVINWLNAIDTKSIKVGVDHKTFKEWHSRYQTPVTYNTEWLRNCYCDSDSPSNLNSWQLRNYNKLKLQDKRAFTFYSDISRDFYLKPLVREEDVLVAVNANNIVLDEEKLDEFNAYANTGDQENVTLLIEMMANVNLEKSGGAILALMIKWRGLIYKNQASKHVNFAGVLSYFGLTRIQFKELLERNVEEKTKGTIWTPTFRRQYAEATAQIEY